MSLRGPVVAIVQARLGSSRLPAKALVDLGGRPMLERVLTRLGRSRQVDRIAVATTTNKRDDMLAAWCRSHHHFVVRGPEDDVLARYRKAAHETGAGTIVRITSDCPFIDPDVVDSVVEALSAAGDYAANTLPPRTFPRGLDCEAFTRAALERAHQEDQDPATREHVTPYIYRNPDRFDLVPVRLDVDLSAYRWTVDTREDLMMARAAYEHFEDDRFTWRDLLNACRAHPEWMQWNAGVRQKDVP